MLETSISRQQLYTCYQNDYKLWASERIQGNYRNQKWPIQIGTASHLKATSTGYFSSFVEKIIVLSGLGVLTLMEFWE
jgi:hypothetical protein